MVSFANPISCGRYIGTNLSCGRLTLRRAAGAGWFISIRDYTFDLQHQIAAAGASGRVIRSEALWSLSIEEAF
jgi:hypothetical protein